MDDNNFISSFLKIMGLDYLDLSNIESNFLEIAEDDEFLGYLTKEEQDLYLIHLFCEGQVVYYQLKQEKSHDEYRYFEELSYWNHNSYLIASLLDHSLRLHFDLSYRYDIKIVENFFAVSYIHKDKIFMLMN